MPSKNLSVSIVIPNFNGQKLLEKNLPLVMAAAKDAEVIVVDDASSDDSVAYLKQKFPAIKVVALKVNGRFAKACNAGVKAAGGEVVVLLNNDVAPAENFLTPLLKPFVDPKIAAVGCIEVDPRYPGRLSGRAGGDWRRGLVVHWRAGAQTDGETFWVSGGSGAFRKRLWLEAGEMDPLYAPAYQEDRDLSYRLMKRGYKTVTSAGSLVEHRHDSTNPEVIGPKAVEVASHRNSLIFVWKNIHDRRLLVSHLVWLPYHLTLTNWRTRGRFGRGFIQACKILPEILGRRAFEKRSVKVTDRNILTRAAGIKA